VAAPRASLRCVTPGLSDRPRARRGLVGRDAAAESVPVGALVGRTLLCVHGGAPAPVLRDALDRLGLPMALVVDDDQRVLGSAARAEIVWHRGLVADVMDPRTPRVPETAPLSEAITPMAYGRARAIAVIGDNDRPAGFVTELDVLRWVAKRGTP
jgi:CBS domain-containing protein